MASRHKKMLDPLVPTWICNPLFIFHFVGVEDEDSKVEVLGALDVWQLAAKVQTFIDD
jgi:hypothetical protein